MKIQKRFSVYIGTLLFSIGWIIVMKPMYLKRILSITIGIINNQQVIFVSY